MQRPLRMNMGKGVRALRGGSEQVGGWAGGQESEERMVANVGQRIGGVVTDQCPRTLPGLSASLNTMWSTGIQMLIPQDLGHL